MAKVELCCGPAKNMGMRIIKFFKSITVFLLLITGASVIVDGAFDANRPPGGYYRMQKVKPQAKEAKVPGKVS